MSAFGLLILRLAVGLSVAAHGTQKLFGWFRGEGVEGTTAIVSKLGFRPARFHATVLGVAELAGGMLLALGLLTPLGAAAVIGVMAAAIGLVHLPRGFFAQRGGFEYPLVLAAAAAAVGLAGPGAWSLDRVIGWNLAGSWGLWSIAAGLGAADVLVGWKRVDEHLASRRRRGLRVIRGSQSAERPARAA